MTLEETWGCDDALPLPAHPKGSTTAQDSVLPACQPHPNFGISRCDSLYLPVAFSTSLYSTATLVFSGLLEDAAQL